MMAMDGNLTERDLKDPKEWSKAEADEFRRRRRGRNLAMLAALGALVLLFYAISIVRLQGPG